MDNPDWNIGVIDCQIHRHDPQLRGERSSLPSKNFPCISMEKLQIGASFY